MDELELLEGSDLFDDEYLGEDFFEEENELFEGDEYDFFDDEDELFEDEYEFENAYEWEGDFEGDLFFKKLWRSAKRGLGKIGRLAKRIGKSGVFKNIAKIGAGALGGLVGGPAGAAIANRIANAVIRESEFEDEYEAEAEFEAEFEMEGGDYEVLAEMAYFAEMAAEAESEEEADQFLGALASLASKIIPKALPLVRKALPFVKKGIQVAGKLMRSTPQTRPLVRTIPQFAAGTITQLARQARSGRPVTQKQIAAAMGRNFARVTAKPSRCARIAQQNRMLAQQLRMAQRRPRRRYPARRTRRPHYAGLMR